MNSDDLAVIMKGEDLPAINGEEKSQQFIRREGNRGRMIDDLDSILNNIDDNSFDYKNVKDRC